MASQLGSSLKLIEKLESAGLLDSPISATFGDMVTGVAEQADLYPENAAMWREYRQALLGLAEEVRRDTGDDNSDLSEFLKGLESA